MKIAVVFLILLGLLAAVSAAVLVQTLSSKPTLAPAASATEDQYEILVAARDLPAMSIVNADSVTKKVVRKQEIPEGALTNSVQIVGRVLTAPVVEGQPFRGSLFAREGGGVYLAASLPPGKRAISISLADWSAMAGLLYPGSVVDILVSLNTGERGSVSTTLLQGLHVVAIGSQSVAADQYSDKNPGAMANRGQVNHRMITLMVDPKQAEILQLATKHGSISLAMRNPLDVTREAKRITTQKELPGFSGDGGSEAAGSGGWVAALAAMAKANAERAALDPTASGNDPFAPVSGTRRRIEPLKSDLWDMLIIRGGVSEKKSFPMEEVEEARTRAAAEQASEQAGDRSDADGADARAQVGLVGQAAE